MSFVNEPPAVGALLAGAHVLDTFSFARVALVEGTPKALDAIAALPDVAGVYPEETITLNLDRVRGAVGAEPTTPNDPSWPTGKDVGIALVDSGLDATHPGFGGRIAAAIRINHAGVVSDGQGDADGHGTHVAGILTGSGAGSQNDRLRGIAPGASLVGIDISDSFTTTSAVRAFEWIHVHRGDYNIRIVSSSWGREKTDAHYDPDDPVIRASDALVADGLVVVFSAGNRGHDGEGTLTTEGTNPNVITVGASTLTGRVESYSSKGPAKDASGKVLSWVKPDLVAPGSGVLSARTSTQVPIAPRSDEERYYWTMNGTSMAAPQAAAAAALLIEERPTLSPLAVQAILQESARDVGSSGPDAESGYGMLDIRAALDTARALQTGQRSITVESRVPVHDAGHLVAATGHVLLLGNAPQTSAPDRISFPLAVPPGGALVDLAFSWRGTGSFVAELHGPGGSVWEFAPTEPGQLHLGHAVQPGAYTFVARPEGPASDVDYALDGSIIVREARVVDQPAEFNSRASSGSAGGFDVPESAAGRMLGALEAKPIMVLTALVLLSCFAAAGVLRRRG